MKEANDNLAVRCRPGFLREMLGNTGVKRALKTYLQTTAFPKSLLIHGPTGSGKTTMARILAMTINCKHRDEGVNPCGHCESCKTPLVDHDSILEINCTVRRKLDDMVKLIGVSILAPRHHYRVFILDELQGATPEAIIALLKPLEEPPPLTIWLLCTSELGKVPKPISGRCVQLALTYPPPLALIRRLREIARIEFGQTMARLLGPYLRKIVEACGGQPRTAIELMGLVGTALTGNPKALRDPRVIERTVQGFLGLP